MDKDDPFNQTLNACPLCSECKSLTIHDNYKVECPNCGHFSLEGLLAVKLYTFDGKLHLLRGYTREHWEATGKPVCLTDSNVESILAQCPITVQDKANKLLLSLQRKTRFFGDEVELSTIHDCALAYAKTVNELRALLRYLAECNWVRIIPPAGPLVSNSIVNAKITGNGMNAMESKTLSPPVTVFISSTCYDLIDLREEMACCLDSGGFIPKMSDDPYRMEVEPTEDSIETCRRNVESADVIVCILDGRYGAPLPPDNQLSATQTEIRYAREQRVPIYIFARDKALADYDQLRHDPNAKTLWVEKHDFEQRQRWLSFAKELQSLASAQKHGHSNWVDPFRDSVQLKKLVLKRLTEFRKKSIYVAP